jgi:hypothetical protein
MSFNRECNGHTIFILALRHYFQTIVTNRKAIVMKKLALHKVVTLVAALAIGSASIANDALARGGGGGATQTIPTNPGLTQTIPTNPGLPPATPEESTGRALGTISPQSPIHPDNSANLPDLGGFSVSPNTSGPSLPQR